MTMDDSMTIALNTQALDQIAELERENAELKKRIGCLNAELHEMTEAWRAQTDIIPERDRLREEVDALRKDKGLLDWLEQLGTEATFHPSTNDRITFIPDVMKVELDSPESPYPGVWTGRTLRDAAMKAREALK